MSNDYRPKGLVVVVHDGQIERAIRRFKKKVQQSGILDEVKRRREYVKPSILKREEKAKARRRWLKQVEAEELEGLRTPRKNPSRR